jgi:uncharacterized protein
MKMIRHDPMRLDMAAFAAEAAVLAGHWPGADLGRLAESQSPPQDGALADVAWQAQGERRPLPAGEPEVWLAVQATAPVWLTCQRCLQPLALTLTLDRQLRFVLGESQAEAMDAELEDDVLALPRWLDLRELVEDELLLALPLVPRHDTCPQPLPVAVGQSEALAGAEGSGPWPEGRSDGVPDEFSDRPNPFAVLRGLKTGGGSGSGSGEH